MAGLTVDVESKLEVEDEDLRTQRASSYALAGISKSIGEYWDTERERKNASITTGYIKQQHGRLRRVVGLLDCLQEEPQLLDPHLKSIVPPLVASFVGVVVDNSSFDVAVRLLQALAEVFYSLCKVRGENLVVRFLKNEPKYIQSMLRTLSNVEDYDHRIEPGATFAGGTTEFDPVAGGAAHWQLRYLLLLWIGHLMLTPFDLSSISSEQDDLGTPEDVNLPFETPSIARQVIRFSLQRISSPTKEQTSAATALVKLASRPDMQRTGILDSMIKWAFAQLGPDRAPSSTMHSNNGVLLFLNGLVRTTSIDDTHRYLPTLFDTINTIFHTGTETFSRVRDSAVSKKLSIKIQRNLVVQLLQVNKRSSLPAWDTSQQMLEERGVLEETIDFFLSSLGDRDTQVRYAASKALSIIAAKLDIEMAQDVVEAVLDSLREDVRALGSSILLKDVSAVSAVRWHGLTLTLAHMIFRGIPSPEQLTGLLEALYLSLVFEQRSTAGNSLGVNVRDAANFGLWSLARRYSTAQLSFSVPDKFRHSKSISSLQAIATQLMVAACLDSSGNVRRGSSAALQELIGRHPNEILRGIDVVQTVDYHGVGLRRRAMTSVAYNASCLSREQDSLYLMALWTSLFDWRGLQAPDKDSRYCAAESLGVLSDLLPLHTLEGQIKNIQRLLKTTPRREVSHRHGITLALSCIANRQIERMDKSEVLDRFHNYWTMFNDILSITPQELSLASMHPELTLFSYIHFMANLAIACTEMDIYPPLAVTDVDTLTVCLRTAESDTLELIPKACFFVGKCLNEQQGNILLKAWTEELSVRVKSLKRAGLMLGLAALTASLASKDGNQDISLTVIETLGAIYEAQDVQAKVMALRCFVLISTQSIELTSPIQNQQRTPSTNTKQHTATPIHPLIQTLTVKALNDYTINERGDVGSFVRIEATRTLLALSHLEWTAGAYSTCLLSVARLSLERLDKVRLAAAECVLGLSVPFDQTLHNLLQSHGVSTHDYFHHRCASIVSDIREGDIDATIASFWIGISSSTGQASDSLQSTTRAALCGILSSLPFYPTTSQQLSLLTVINTLISLLSHNHTERTLLPLLETIAFLFDASFISQIADKLNTTILLSLVQKAHFKSTSMPKLTCCTHIYLGIGMLGGSTRSLVIKKLVGMLGHPFAKIRMGVAEVLYVLCSVGHEREDGEGAKSLLGGVDWGGGRDEVRKEGVRVVRGLLGVG